MTPRLLRGTKPGFTRFHQATKSGSDDSICDQAASCRDELNTSTGALTLRLWALTDGKNVTAIALGNDVAERYAYDAFGSTIVLTADFSPRAGNISEFGRETRYCGYRWDSESELYQVRFRYYHSVMGRWVSRDPLDEIADRNLLAYCFNAAPNFVDRLGLAGDVTHGLSRCAPNDSCESLAAKAALFLRSIAERVAEMATFTVTGQPWENMLATPSRYLSSGSPSSGASGTLKIMFLRVCYPLPPIKDPFPLPEWKPEPYKIPVPNPEVTVAAVVVAVVYWGNMARAITIVSGEESRSVLMRICSHTL